MSARWRSLGVALICAGCAGSQPPRRGGPGDASADTADASATPPADVVRVVPDVVSPPEASTSDLGAPGSTGTDARDAHVMEAGTPETGRDGGDETGPALPARVLLYHFSTLVIDTLPAQLTFYKNLLAGWGWASDDSVDPATFTDEGLAAYGAVAMINTCFFPFGDGKDGAKESAALQRFVARGGGLFGAHCAAVTFQSVSPPPLYNQLFGGQEGNGFFDGTSACRKLGTHPTIDALPATFDFPGNLDNNQFLSPSSTITVRCKWSGGDMRDVAVSWVRAEGAGRVFYTNFGKVVSDLTDPVLGAKHIVPGLAWVLRR